MPAASENPVSGNTHTLAFGQRIVHFKQMAHVVTNENHAKIIPLKHLSSIIHHRLGLPSIHKRIESLVLRHERIARSFIIAYMGTQDDKTVFPFCKVKITSIVFDVKIKLPAGVDIEAVENHFCKLAMIEIGVQKGAPHSLVSSSTKVMVYRQIALTGKKHAERNHENIGEGIQATKWKMSHHPY